MCLSAINFMLCITCSHDNAVHWISGMGQALAISKYNDEAIRQAWIDYKNSMKINSILSSPYFFKRKKKKCRTHEQTTHLVWICEANARWMERMVNINPVPFCPAYKKESQK